MARPAAHRALLAIGWFAVLIVIERYGHGWVRGSLGDLAVVPWVIHTLGAVPPLTAWGRSRVAFGLGLAFTLELAQLLGGVGPGDPWWMHVVLGSTFDPLDLLHYVIGAAIAFGGEHALGLPDEATG